MSNLLSIPFEDDYETTLAQAWDGSNTTMYLKAVPTATTPSGTNFSYLVVDPWKSTMQAVKVTAWENVGNTATVTTATIKKGSGVNYSAVTHASWATVRFSNNYQFWEDLQTAINTKLDNDGDNETTTWNLSVAGSNFRFRKDGNDMKFRDDTTAEVSLAQLTAGTSTDHKFLNSVVDTTASYLATKLTWWDGITATTINPGWNETLDLDIDLTDTNIFVQTSSWASDSGKIPRLNSSWQIATGFLPAIDTIFGNGADWVQTDANLTITGSNNTFITKNFSSWTAGSTARTCTVTPTNCIVWIKIQGNADFTNRTFNFAWVGWPWWAQQTGWTGNVWTVGNSNKYIVTNNWLGWVLWATSAAWWAAWAKLSSSLNTNLFDIDAFCWAWWGSWGSNSQSGTNGWAGWAWWAGWGWLIITVWGTVVFSTTVATVAWSNGTAWTAGTGWASGWGGGWWWWGGTFVCLYRWTLTGSLTPTVTGWTGWAGGTGAGTTAGAGGWGAGSLFNAWTAWASTSSQSTGWLGWNGWAWVYLIQKI